MPNDAKLGLVLGIGLVVVIGIVFFRTDPPASGSNPPATSVSAAQVAPTDEVPPSSPPAN